MARLAWYSAWRRRTSSCCAPSISPGTSAGSTVISRKSSNHWLNFTNSGLGSCCTRNSSSFKLTEGVYIFLRRIASDIRGLESAFLSRGLLAVQPIQLEIGRIGPRGRMGRMRLERRWRLGLILWRGPGVSFGKSSKLTSVIEYQISSIGAKRTGWRFRNAGFGCGDLAKLLFAWHRSDGRIPRYSGRWIRPEHRRGQRDAPGAERENAISEIDDEPGAPIARPWPFSHEPVDVLKVMGTHV